MSDIKTTYNIFTRGGANIGTISDFQKKMQDPNYRKKAYNALVKAGDASSSFDDFESEILMSDKTTGESIPEKIKEKEQEAQVLEEQEKVQAEIPENDFLIDKFKKKELKSIKEKATNPFEVKNYLEKEKVNVNDPIKKKLETLDYNKKEEEDNKPNNSLEWFVDGLYGNNAMKAVRYFNDKILNENDPSLLKKRISDDFDSISKRMGYNTTDDLGFSYPDAYSALIGIPEIKTGPRKIFEENKPFANYKDEENRVKDILSKKSYNDIAVEALREMSTPTDLSSGNIKDFTSSQLNKKRLQGTNLIDEHDRLLMKFLDNNQKAKGYETPAESFVDLFISPLSPKDKEFARNYMNFISKNKPLEYNSIASQFRDNLYDTKDIEAKIVDGAIKMHDSVLGYNVGIFKSKGHDKVYMDYLSLADESEKLSNYRDNLTNKLSTLKEGSIAYINTNKKISEYENKQRTIDNKLNELSVNPSTKAIIDSGDKLKSDASSLEDLQYRAFKDTVNPYFQKQATDIKEKDKAVDYLTKLKNSNNPILERQYQYSVVGRAAWNSVVDLFSGYVALGATMNTGIKMLFSNDEKDKKAGIEFYNTMDKINQKTEWAKLTTLDTPMIDDKGDINYSNLLPNLASTVVNMAGLISGGKSVGKALTLLGAPKYIAPKSIGLIMAGVALEMPQKYKDAVAANPKNGAKAFDEAFKTSLTVAFGEIIAPNTNFLSKFKVPTELRQLIQSNRLIPSIKNYTKVAGKEVIGEIAQEYYQGGIEYGMNTLYNYADGNNIRKTGFGEGELKETALLTALSTILLHSGTLSVNGITPNNYNSQLHNSALFESVKDNNTYSKTLSHLNKMVDDGDLSTSKFNQLESELANARLANLRAESYKTPSRVPSDKLKSLILNQIELENKKKEDPHNILLKEQISTLNNAIEIELGKKTGIYKINGETLNQQQFVSMIKDPKVIEDISNGDTSVSLSGDLYSATLLKNKLDNYSKLKSIKSEEILKPDVVSNNPVVSEVINTHKENNKKENLNLEEELQLEQELGDKIPIIDNELKELNSELNALESSVDYLEDKEQYNKATSRIIELKKEIKDKLQLNKEVKKPEPAQEAAEITKQNGKDENQNQREGLLSSEKESTIPNEEIVDSTIELKNKNKNEVDKLIKGKLIYSLPGTGKTHSVSNSNNPDYIDADELIGKELTKLNIDISNGVGKGIISLMNKDKKKVDEVYSIVLDKINKLKKEGKTIFTGNKPFIKHADILLSKSEVDDLWTTDSSNREVSPIEKKGLSNILNSFNTMNENIGNTIILGEGQRVSDFLSGDIAISNDIIKNIKEKEKEIKKIKKDNLPKKELIQNKKEIEKLENEIIKTTNKATNGLTVNSMFDLLSSKTIIVNSDDINERIEKCK